MLTEVGLEDVLVSTLAACTVDLSEVGIRLSYQWQSVLKGENETYFFPDAITPFMKMRYKGPAIYRWNVHKSTPGDKKLVYVGEAKELCPGRIKGYLDPGSSQKNQQRDLRIV